MKNNDPVFEKVVHGWTVKIHYDQDCESPRTMDNVGTILYSHRREVLGDKRVDVEEIKAVMKNRNNICLPVYAYIHSGTSINTTGFSCQWDSGQCGVIFVTKEKARKEFGRLTKKTLDKVVECLKGEIKVYDQFMQGECYGFTLHDSTGEETDSCWGFLGYDSAGALADEIIKEQGLDTLDSVKLILDLEKEVLV